MTKNRKTFTKYSARLRCTCILFCIAFLIIHTFLAGFVLNQRILTPFVSPVPLLPGKSPDIWLSRHKLIYTHRFSDEIPASTSSLAILEQNDHYLHPQILTEHIQDLQGNGMLAFAKIPCITGLTLNLDNSTGLQSFTALLKCIQLPKGLSFPFRGQWQGCSQWRTKASDVCHLSEEGLLLQKRKS